MSTSWCTCEPTETARSLGDDTHAVVTRPKWAPEHGLHRVWSRCVGGWRAWLDRCSKQGRGQRSERKTPTPCASGKETEKGDGETTLRLFWLSHALCIFNANRPVQSTAVLYVSVHDGGKVGTE